MAFVDHLAGKKGDELMLEVAFGRHVIEGDLAKSIVTGASPNHVVTVQQILGESFGKNWKYPVGLWFRGINRPSAKFVFYSGSDNQPVDSIFNKDTPHRNTVWVRCELPNGAEPGVPEFDTKNNPPTGLFGIYDCQLGDIYDAVGDIVDNDVLLTNPTDVLIFGLKEIRRFPNSRIDFASLENLRIISDTTETADYTILPNGVGLTGRYYDGTNFQTLKTKRVDPIVYFESSSGAPELGLLSDSFSVRWEGKIKPQFSETYTFYLNADNGARLWVNNTQLINQWSDDGTSTPGAFSGTIALAAGQFYDIKLEWNEGGSAAEFRFEWSSASQPREVVPQNVLYPKNEAVKKFQTHLAFTQRTTFDEFLNAVCATCNGGWQDANGKLRFFSFDNLTPSFTFDESNINELTFKFEPRFSQSELLNMPNRFIASGRDLDNRYLKPFDPELFYDLPDLQAVAGRIISETVPVGNTNRWQGLKNLAHYAKLRTAPNICEFEGMPQTLPVLQGDLVLVNKPDYGFFNKQFLVLEATDKSIDAGAADRIFKLLEWS